MEIINNNICRTCMTESESMTPIFSNTNDQERTLKEVLYFVANISPNHEDTLPKHICKPCEVTLYQFDSFKRRCIEIEAKLTNLKNGSVQVKNEEQNRLHQCSSCLAQYSNALELQTHVSCTHSRLKELADIKEVQETMHIVEIENKTEYLKQEIDSQDYAGDDYDQDYLEDDNYLVTEDTKVDIDINSEICKKNEFKVKKEKQKSPTCLPCGKVFKNTKTYNKHLRNKHAHYKVLKLINRSECSESKPTSTKSSVREKIHQCSHCMRKFVKKTTLALHLKRHETHLKHICSICKREFVHKAHLDNHILSLHTTENGYKCDVCKSSFPTQDSLELHKTSHNDQKKHVCTFCHKAFHMLSSLKDHLRVHTGEKPYLCPMCGKSFSQNTNMQEHLRRHQGIKPFKCELCDRGFVSKGELAAHTRKHSGSHPFICSDCGGGFTTSSSLVKHRRTHTGERPYACDLCHMRFAASGTLKNHRRTHTGEKPYKCSHCEKAFVQKNDLISHTRCHTGERPYVCSDCGQAFRQSSALNTHKKLHRLPSVGIGVGN